jgi:hypothetical protein
MGTERDLRKKLTVEYIRDALTVGINSGKLPILAENISMYDAKVKRDLLRDGCKHPLTGM